MVCLHPVSIVDPSRNSNPRHSASVRMQVPCGRCINCLKNRRNDWYVRCCSELLLHPVSSFVTLTYRDDCIPMSNGLLTLCVSDLQRFFKRVRKSGISFRYLAVGEYGKCSGRPHYHIIFFGYFDPTVNGQNLLKFWSDGFIVSYPVSDAGILYTLKYCLKNSSSVREEFKAMGVEPPFMVMSRRPGIGYNYLDTHKDYHFLEHADEFRPYTMLNFVKYRLPLYYKRKYGYIDSLAETRAELALVKQREELEAYLKQYPECSSADWYKLQHDKELRLESLVYKNDKSFF